MLKSLSLFLFLFLLTLSSSFAQQSKRVLFLGNSYTATNNIPQILSTFAQSAGDTLVYDGVTPGGYRFRQHAGNATSLQKIAQGNWDYVVLQEQSQLPALDIEIVNEEVFPFARALDSTIRSYNACTETVFYMTWGRKNGDPTNCNEPTDPMCTYRGMDSMLNLRYRMMADSNEAILSPVGAVWNYLRTQHPEIELYQADESHPSLAGSYAAAVCFYAVLFRSNPTQIGYNYFLSTSEANAIKNAVKVVVYDSLSKWHIGEYDPLAAFDFSLTGKTVQFTNQSKNADNYFWDFGNGDTTRAFSTVYTYNQDGLYLVSLTASRCGMVRVLSKQLTISSVGLIESQLSMQLQVYPNPSSGEFMIQVSEKALGLGFKIFNAQGILLNEGKLMEQNQSIQLAEASSGIYYLVSENGSNQILLLQK